MAPSVVKGLVGRGHSVMVQTDGGGVAGLKAARIAMGMGMDMDAKVTIIERSLARLKHVDQLYGDCLRTLYSTTDAV
jgi:alanine dehydrogenase